MELRGLAVVKEEGKESYRLLLLAQTVQKVSLKPSSLGSEESTFANGELFASGSAGGGGAGGRGGEPGGVVDSTMGEGVGAAGGTAVAVAAACRVRRRGSVDMMAMYDDPLGTGFYSNLHLNG